MTASRVCVRWGALPLLGLLCLALAACGGTASARISPTATPTATAAKGAGGATPTATTVPPPYAFPAAWRDAPGLPLAATADPTAYAFAPSDGRIGYLCIGASGRLYATRDGGDTWQLRHISAFTGCTGAFIDAGAASDLFIQTPTAAQTNGIPNGVDLWRSRDGGATWKKLSAAPTQGLRVEWAAVAVLGSQLLGQVIVDQEGFLQNPLYTSDDGGATWRPFAQSVASQGYTLSSFTIINGAIYAQSMKGTTPGGMQQRLSPAAQPMAASLSGQPPVSPTWWRSLDGGATWRQVTLPGDSLQVTRSSDGQRTYALSVKERDVAPTGQSPTYDATMWWSADGGATWKKLPDMAGLADDFVIGGSPVALAPDGSVYAHAQHDPQGYGDDAGVFRIQPNGAAPAWQPLAPGGTQAFAANETPTGLRLWSIGALESDSYLKYLDVA
ncbi:MAG TPA: hypothetical protein VF739_10350 [Ktedonobacterales bacterium]